MKIVMIGPVYPYKGGIAHYTSLMTQELSKEHDVTMISFKLQYPKLLYPRNTQKDYANTAFQIDPTYYLINTINPLSYFRTANFIKSLQPDLVIMQWWHPFFSLAYWSIIKLLRGRYEIVFLCHNVFPHEKFPLQRVLTKKTLGKGDAYIVQSRQDEQDLLAIRPDAIFRRTVHPTYNAFKLTDISQPEARKKLGIPAEAQVLLFFGFVREYKGLKHLLDAMPRIVENLPECKLLVVGDILAVEKEEYLQRIQQTGCKGNILLVNDYVPDKEVENYFSASDLVVLPYESATQSGIVQIAYGFHKPVVATAVGGLPEVVLDGKTGYIVPSKDHKRLSEAVVRFFIEKQTDTFQASIESEAYKYSWERMREIVEELEESIP